MSMNQDGSISGGGPICTVVMSSTHDQPPKISPSVILSDRIEPPQHIQPPTFYVSCFSEKKIKIEIEIKSARKLEREKIKEKQS